MNDLESAVTLLAEEKLSLAIVKDGKVLYKAASPGVRHLIAAIEYLGESMRGASAADKIVGKAAALLFAHAGVRSVYGLIISREGLRVLQEHGIGATFGKKAPFITDREGSDLCPMERLCAGLESPDDAFSALRAFIDKAPGR